MFVLVVDTSLMNVSISAVVKDLARTWSSVQAAIALEALVSAAFILISSKVGDLIGRKRAYVLGLLRLRDRSLGDDVGAERDGDHRLLGDHRRARGIAVAASHAVVDPRELRGCGSGRGPTRSWGRPPRSLPRSGRCFGGFVTTFLSWRVGFGLEVVVIAVVLSQIKLVNDVALHRAAADRRGRRGPQPCSGWAASCSGILVWQEGGESRRIADRDRSGRARVARLLPRAAQAGREADTA